MCSEMLNSVNFACHHFLVEMHVFSGFEQLLVTSDGYLNDPGSIKDAFRHHVS